MTEPPHRDNLARARALFGEGVVAFEAADFESAERCFEQALALAPERPSVLSNLGVTRVRRGRFAEALTPLDKATRLEPDKVEAWLHLGLARSETGDLPGAVTAFDRALTIAPEIASAWVHRGSALREMGRREEAAGSFEKALALGADDELTRFYLGAVGRHQAPRRPPTDYVAALFDGYAATFDSHLQALGYQAHRQVVDMMRARATPPWRSVLDLGCGTGLVGHLVRDACTHLVGVDLSARMVEQARRRGVYDEVVHAELGAWLATQPPQGVRHDVAFAADVFIYVGALESVLRDLRQHLRPRGWLAFSVEALDDAHGDWRLQGTLRYAHSAAYLRRLAAATGWTVHDLRSGTIRLDQARPLPGLYVTLQREADRP